MTNSPTGKLIVYEGIDGSGKTTQLRRCATWLSSLGYANIMLREPTDGPFGQRLRQSAESGRLAAEEERDLFIQDRTWNVQNNILPALRADKVILLDRFYFSSIAYQGARGLNLGEIRRLNEAIAPRPDLVLLFDLDPEAAVHRIQSQRGESLNLFEKLDYLRKVRQIFLALEDPFIVRIQADAAPDMVESQVQAAILDLLQR